DGAPRAHPPARRQPADAAARSPPRRHHPRAGRGCPRTGRSRLMLQRDIELVVLGRDEKARRRKAARARINDKLRRGELPTFQEIVEARGLVVRERRDSIFSDAWVPLALLFLILGLAG